MADIRFLESPPVSDRVTPYDERHMVTYLRLLDADADGAGWQEIVRLIFAIDPAACPDRARRIHASHLERARWMARQGYRDLTARPGGPIAEGRDGSTPDGTDKRENERT